MQAYVDMNMIGAGLEKASIVGHDGSVKGCSPGFQLQPQEVSAIIAAFDDALDIRMNGILLEGAKYYVLGFDGRSVYGKKGSGGVSCFKTTQHVLIGVHTESREPDAAVAIVSNLADYFIEQGQ